jgi:hypothetical protein
MELAGATLLMPNVFVVVLVGLLESLARIVKLKLPSAVGVPEIAPVPALRERPAGSAPLVMAHV